MNLGISEKTSNKNQENWQFNKDFARKVIVNDLKN